MLLLVCRDWYVRCPPAGGRQAATEDWCKRRGNWCSSHRTLAGGRQNLEGLIRSAGSALSFQGRRRTIIRCRWQAAANGALARIGRLVFNGVLQNCRLAVYEARQD